MKIKQIRNATLVVSIGPHTLLVDPMLSDVGAMPGFKMFGGGRRANPLVPLPEGTLDTLATVTGVVLTHEHPDHFDVPALQWVRQRGLPVWANSIDAPNLRAKGLDVRLLVDGSLGTSVEVIASRHGQGVVGWIMGPVAGYYLAHPGEPSLYLTGDSVLSEAVLEAVERLHPDVIVAPAGAANLGMGGDILFSVDELMRLVRASTATVVLNHLEALDHCPTTRAALRARVRDEGLSDRVCIPDDGETLSFESTPTETTRARPKPSGQARPGAQKWLTALFAGT